MRCVILSVAAAVVLSACSEGEHHERPFKQSPDEIAFAAETLDALQRQSFRSNREYCGYIGVNAQGELEATPARRGRSDRCRPKRPPSHLQVLASYHTHGAYSDWMESEAPSYDDLLADIEEGVDGYIATPGGRLWFNDTRQQAAILLCDDGCLESDPAYRSHHDDFIERYYTLEELGS